MLLLLACEPEPSLKESTPTPHDYIYEEEVLPSASLSPEEVEAAITEGLSLALELTAQPVFPAYQAAMLGEDVACPNYYDYEGSVYWYDACTSAAGSRFEGYSFYIPYVDMDDGYGNLYNGEALYGVSKITTIEGYIFEAGGSAAYYDLTHIATSPQDIDYTYFVSAVQGSFSYDGPEAEETWLSEDLAPDLSYTGAWIPAYSGNLGALDGGIAGLSGSVEYLVMDNLILYSNGLSSCPEEPGGGVSVRGSDGYWYDVTFDGPIEFGEEVAAATCDGCGKLWFQGEALGEVCVDASLLIDWEVSPW
jgi:hypothetical protein